MVKTLSPPTDETEAEARIRRAKELDALADAREGAMMAGQFTIREVPYVRDQIDTYRRRAFALRNNALKGR